MGGLGLQKRGKGRGMERGTEECFIEGRVGGGTEARGSELRGWKGDGREDMGVEL